MLYYYLAEFSDRIMEGEYRSYYLKQDNLQSIVGIILMLVPSAFFLYSDYLLFGVVSQFYHLLVARVVFITFSLCSIIILLRTGRQAVSDIIVLLYLFSLISLIFYVNTTRPPTYILFTFIDIVVLISVYFMFSNRLIFQVIPALYLTITDMIIINTARIDISPVAMNVIWISYVLSNVLGILTSWRLHSYRRRQYIAYEEEKRLKEDLKTALDKVKTLSGLLPICANCKKVRNDKGYWTQIETYLEEHSDAQLSHGLCEDCIRDLYGDKKWYKEK